MNPVPITAAPVSAMEHPRQEHFATFPERWDGIQRATRASSCHARDRQVHAVRQLGAVLEDEAHVRDRLANNLLRRRIDRTTPASCSGRTTRAAASADRWAEPRER